jgi:heat shock protein HtpX
MCRPVVRADVEWTSDRELTLRMVVSAGLSTAGYACLVVVLASVGTGQAILVGGGLGVGLLALVVYGDVVALWAVDGHRISPDDDRLPDVRARVDRLAAAADVPAPTLAVTTDDEPNAFTAGVGDRRVICVTTGLIETLEGAELDAVLAHELAHVKHRDAVVMTVAAFPLTVALTLGAIGWASAESGDDRGAGVFALLGAAALAAVSLPPVVVFSRYREFAADRGAVAITGAPGALASALRRLDGWDGPPNRDARTVASLSAFCVHPVHRTLPLPSFHPSTDRRVERLRGLERSVGS